jgi:hypothetical protein
VYPTLCPPSSAPSLFPPCHACFPCLYVGARCMYFIIIRQVDRHYGTAAEIKGTTGHTGRRETAGRRASSRSSSVTPPPCAPCRRRRRQRRRRRRRRRQAYSKQQRRRPCCCPDAHAPGSWEQGAAAWSWARRRCRWESHSASQIQPTPLGALLLLLPATAPGPRRTWLLVACCIICYLPTPSTQEGSAKPVEPAPAPRTACASEPDAVLSAPPPLKKGPACAAARSHTSRASRPCAL